MRDDVRERARALVDDLVGSGEETGLQVAAYLHGELVVDVWGGLADPMTGRPVAGDALFHSWSSGKGVAATAVHVLAERGLIEYDVPITAYWPKFGAHGKARATVRHALTHSTGVPQLPAGLTELDQLADWDRMCALVADLEPLWPPGTDTGYHAFTFGWIVGELVRRASGRQIGDVIRDDIAGPLGVEKALFCGVPESELDRVARLELAPTPSTTDMPTDVPGLPEQIRQNVERTAAPPLSVGPELGNDPVFLGASVPATGTMSARALARMYAALIGPVDGVRLLSPASTERVSTIQTSAADRVLGLPLQKSLGYMNGYPGTGGRSTAFGMNGSGGSTGFADPEYGFAFALTKNRMNGFVPPTRDAAEVLAREVRAALGIPEAGG